MIVNTSLMIRGEGALSRVHLVLVSDAIDDDSALLSFLRLEPLAVAVGADSISLVLCVPDQERILCRTAPLSASVVEMMRPALAEEGLALLWAENAEGSREREIRAFGDGRVDLTGRFAEATARLQGGDPQGALDLALACKRRRPSWPRPAVLAGQISLRLEAYEEARRHFEGALELEERCVDAHAGLGRLAQRLSRAEDARVHLGRALFLYPNHVTALLHFAMLAFDEEDPTAGRRALARAAAIHEGAPWRDLARRAARAMEQDEEEWIASIEAAAREVDRSLPVVGLS